jgi:hypothetical protein
MCGWCDGTGWTSGGCREFACKMPCKPDAAVWRTLLMGCVVHSKVGVAESMGQHLLYINFKNDSTHVMLANVYSAAG